MDGTFVESQALYLTKLNYDELMTNIILIVIHNGINTIINQF